METQPRSRPVCQHLGPNTKNLCEIHCECPWRCHVRAGAPRWLCSRIAKFQEALKNRRRGSREGAADLMSGCMGVRNSLYFEVGRKLRARLQLLIHAPKSPEQRPIGFSAVFNVPEEEKTARRQRETPRLESTSPTTSSATGSPAILRGPARAAARAARAGRGAESREPQKPRLVTLRSSSRTRPWSFV